MTAEMTVPAEVDTVVVAAEPRTVRAPIGTRVAVVSDAIYPYNKGGKEFRYHEICRRLVAQGVEVDLYTMQWWDGPKHQVVDGVRMHALCRLVPLYTGARRSILQAVVFSLACLKLLWQPFDVIEADHMPYIPLFALRVVATLKRKPLVVTWHEVWGRDYWREYLGAAGAIAAAIERLAMRLPNTIVADVHETARRLHENGVGSDRVVVVPIGVDVERIDAVPPAAVSFDVVFVGRLLEHKRVEVLVRALAALRARGFTLTCAVIGEGPEHPALVELAAELGVTDTVSFFGRVEADADVWATIKASRVLALPSVREGFGIVVLEALACGVPVLTSDHADNQARRLVWPGRTGVVCASEVDAVADALLGLIERPIDVPSVRDDALAAFSWDGIIESLLDVYAGPNTRSAT